MGHDFTLHVTKSVAGIAEMLDFLICENDLLLGASNSSLRFYLTLSQA
jgi:hypothetical protein